MKNVAIAGMALGGLFGLLTLLALALFYAAAFEMAVQHDVPDSSAQARYEWMAEQIMPFVPWSGLLAVFLFGSSYRVYWVLYVIKKISPPTPSPEADSPSPR